ncbi:hypothetical protein SUNI508_10600 [Seiridium unicorne]|uniref:Uncharacterized protein n=1 Tax=Seiridium unicorne TaxID=138068 RepID=A0ABR2UK37_9PEZI
MSLDNHQQDDHAQIQLDELFQGCGEQLQAEMSESTTPTSTYPSKSRFSFRRTARKGNINTTISSWWWRELGSALLSLICISLVIAILFSAGNTPLGSWPLAIQPNSLISVLTTIGKSDMIVVITSCISQLKWRYFQTQSHPLSHLQSFEEASRGPWGSLVFPGAAKTRSAVVASALALVTIFSLGFEPISQQILEFPSRTARIENVTAYVSRALSYQSSAFNVLDHGVSSTNLLDLAFHEGTIRYEAALINGIVGAVSTPSLSCPEPAAQCSWGGYSSLGYCYDFRNLTTIMSRDCSQDQNSTLLNYMCVYDYAGWDPVDPKTNMTWIVTLDPGRGVQNVIDWTFFTASPTYHIDTIGGAEFALTSARQTRAVPDIVELLYSRWHICEQTFENVTSSSGVLNTGNKEGQDSYTILVYRSNSTGQEYTIAKQAIEQTLAYLNNVFDVDFTMHPGWNDPNAQVVNATLGNHRLVQMGYFLNSTNLHNMTENVAKTLSAQMQSNSPGDNTNLTLVAGEAFKPETYIYVRCEWLVLPLLETVVTIVLLVITMVRTRHAPLVKTSIIAAMMYGLFGWRPEDIQAGIADTGEMLERRARGMPTYIDANSHGQMRFYLDITWHIYNRDSIPLARKELEIVQHSPTVLTEHMVSPVLFLAEIDEKSKAVPEFHLPSTETELASFDKTSSRKTPLIEEYSLERDYFSQPNFRRPKRFPRRFTPPKDTPSLERDPLDRDSLPRPRCSRSSVPPIAERPLAKRCKIEEDGDLSTPPSSFESGT